jgi:hypothetical protein
VLSNFLDSGAMEKAVVGGKTDNNAEKLCKGIVKGLPQGLNNFRVHSGASDEAQYHR